MLRESFSYFCNRCFYIEFVQRYFLKIAYNGTAYHGWQVQPNAITVQEVLQDCLQKLQQQALIETVGCGRTDAGVHATEFYVHFDLEQPPIENFIFRLNRFLPKDIVAYELLPVHAGAHARFDATSRSYEYHLHTFKNAFKEHRSAFVEAKLNVEAMNVAASELLSHDDFASFCKANAGSKTTICDVRKATWSTNGDSLCFTITADRFLRNMVRAVVGTLLEIGKGKIPASEMKKIINDHDRSSAGTSAPAGGLYLTEITYPYIDKKA